jgi:hypothetical protein
MKTAATVEKLKKQFSHRSLQNPAGFRTVFTGSTGINLKQQNRTDHLLQIPDIFICYRQKDKGPGRRNSMGMSDNAV